jgi:hypothetical protein
MSGIGRAVPSDVATARFMKAVYALPCTAHEAASGQPSWTFPI